MMSKSMREHHINETPLCAILTIFLLRISKHDVGFVLAGYPRQNLFAQERYRLVGIVVDMPYGTPRIGGMALPTYRQAQNTVIFPQS
jgi:hypothetical protein